MRLLINSAKNLIDNCSVAFLSSVDADSYPNNKAMLPPRKVDGVETIYFSTNTSSLRVEQFRLNGKACLYFADQLRFSGVMLVGNVDVLEDSEHKKLLWREGDEMFYPKGVTDPDYCVLKFSTIKGRLYNNLKSEDFLIN